MDNRAKEGDLVAVKCEDLDDWSRGKVLSEDKRVVELYDCGQVSTYTEVIPLPEQLASLPLLAAVFTLENYSEEVFEALVEVSYKFSM